ncbi:hypothetical protein BROUX41_001382 [Berkeleyomyces rouxiae]|uniref:uncharacterized protein n=1 Tax=Berkeleyomyces rouxiae TaxID=2035830 RepID=UPI003B7BA1D9
MSPHVKIYIPPSQTLFALDLALNVSNIQLIQRIITEEDSHINPSSSKVEEPKVPHPPSGTKLTTHSPSTNPVSADENLYVSRTGRLLRLPHFRIENGSWECLVGLWMRDLISLNNHVRNHWTNELVTNAGLYQINYLSGLSNKKRKLAMTALHSRRLRGRISRVMKKIKNDTLDSSKDFTVKALPVVVNGTSQWPQASPRKNHILPYTRPRKQPHVPTSRPSHEALKLADSRRQVSPELEVSTSSFFVASHVTNSVKSPVLYSSTDSSSSCSRSYSRISTGHSTTSHEDDDGQPDISGLPGQNLFQTHQMALAIRPLPSRNNSAKT